MSRKVQGDNPNYRPNRPRRRKVPQKFNPMSAETESEEASGGEGMSSSAKKMKATSADIIINFTHCYRIIEFISVFAAISDISVCKTCKRKQTFGETGSRGLGFKVAVTCACGTVLINSGPFINNSFEINRRIVFVMRLLGVARKGINIFCGMMDLGCELSVRAYGGIIQHIHASLQKMYNDMCHKAVEEEKPIYEDLSRDDLLERCLGGHTQNANESFNAIVWRLAPKHLNCGKKIIEIAAFLAAGMFSEGFSFVLQTMQDLNIVIGQQSKGFADNDDKRRIEQQERRSLDATKEARTFRQQEKTAQLQQFEEEEGLLYAPGIAD